MRTLLYLTIVGTMLTLVTASTDARADVIATLQDSVGDPHSVTLAPGSSFDVDVYLELVGGANLASGQFKLIETTAIASGFFTLESITSSPGWDVPFEDPSPTLVPPSWPLGPDGDMGTLAADIFTGNVSGSILSLHLLLSGSATPGTYTLNLADAIFGDVDFVMPLPYSFGEDYRVEVTAVVPAPAPDMLALLGLGIMAASFKILEWRRRQVDA